MTAKYQFLKPSPWRGINKAPSALGYTTVSLILGWRERRRFWVKAFEHEREQRAYTQKLHSFAPHSQVFSPGTMEKSEQKLLFRSPLSFSFHLSDLAWKKGWNRAFENIKPFEISQRGRLKKDCLKNDDMKIEPSETEEWRDGVFFSLILRVLQGSRKVDNSLQKSLHSHFTFRPVARFNVWKGKGERERENFLKGKSQGEEIRRTDPGNLAPTYMLDLSCS